MSMEQVSNISLFDNQSNKMQMDYKLVGNQSNKTPMSCNLVDNQSNKSRATGNLTNQQINYKCLSDHELEQTLKSSVQEENKLKIEILHLLAEIERRRLYSKEHPSLFEYCVKVLKYSSAAAQRRIDSMRALKLIPELEGKIVTGELNLSSISYAQSFFRQEAKSGKNYSVEDKKEVLEKLENKSSRECIQELIKISPQSIPQEKRRELTPNKTELKVVLNKDLVKSLDKIKALLSHSNPNMTDQELIEYMAKIVLSKIDPAEKSKRIQKRKEAANPAIPESALESVIHGSTKSDLKTISGFAKSTLKARARANFKVRTNSNFKFGTNSNSASQSRPIPASEVKNQRYIPAALKQQVYMRDKGQCTYPQCNSRKFLEYDHIQPIALGGKTCLQNLRLLCRAHNQRAAINKLGFDKMAPFLRPN